MIAACPKGPFAERWAHAGGCRRWFNVVRDTATYDVLAVHTGAAPSVTEPGVTR